MLCCWYNSRINMGVTSNVDCCNNKFSYDLFSLFTCSHRNANVEIVAVTISVLQQIHRVTYARGGKGSSM